VTELNRRVRNDSIATRQSLVATAVVLAALLFLDLTMLEAWLSLTGNRIADATSATGTTDLDSPFNIGINQTAHLTSADIDLSFVDVTEDSRCPSDVQCIWAGRVSVLVELKIASSGENLGRFGMTLTGDVESDIGNNDHLSIGGYLIELVNVMPYPISTRVIEPSQFVATLTVSKAEERLAPSSPVAVDVLGRILNDVKTGETIMLATRIFNTADEQISCIVIVEARSLNESEITHFLDFSQITLPANSSINATAGTSWTAERTGNYQIRVFLIDSFDNPIILSPVLTSRISITEMHGNSTAAQDFHVNASYTVPKDVKNWISLIANEAHEEWPDEAHKFISNTNAQILPHQLTLYSGQAVAFHNSDGPWDSHHSHNIIIKESGSRKEVWRSATLGYPFFNMGTSLSELVVLNPGNYTLSMLTNGSPTDLKTNVTIRVLSEPMNSNATYAFAGAFLTPQKPVPNPEDNDGGMHQGHLAYYQTEMSKKKWEIVSIYNFDFASCTFYNQRTSSLCVTDGSSIGAYWADNKTPYHSLILWKTRQQSLSEVGSALDFFTKENVYT
jgi:hypothetical protein